MPRPTELPEPWRSMAEKLGGVQAIADVLEVDVRTVRRWAEELPSHRLKRDWIHAAFLAAGVKPPC